MDNIKPSSKIETENNFIDQELIQQLPEPVIVPGALEALASAADQRAPSKPDTKKTTEQLGVSDAIPTWFQSPLEPA